MNAATLLENTVSTSAFNRGQAARCFEKVSDGSPVVVLKNNAPYRVVLTASDFARISQLEEDNALLELALSRIERNAGKPGIPAEAVYAELGFTEADLEDFDETVEFA